MCPRGAHVETLGLERAQVASSQVVPQDVPKMCPRPGVIREVAETQCGGAANLKAAVERGDVRM
eukprot:11765369-Alexandrium_andersonii.AAC.1